MARYRENLSAQKDRPQRSTQKDQGVPFANSTLLNAAADLLLGKYPQDISKAKAQTPLRRSARLNPGCSEHVERPHPSPANKALCKEVRHFVLLCSTQLPKAIP